MNLIKEIKTIGRLKKAKAEQEIVSPTDKNNEIPIVLTGLLKVMRQDPEKRCFCITWKPERPVPCRLPAA